MLHLAHACHFWTTSTVLTEDSRDSNIRPTQEKPMRDGEVCPKYRTEPFEKPVITDRLLQLAGVKAY
jgi:hypothetical protein